MSVLSADSWHSRLVRYRWRARTARGYVSVASEDLRRLLDERDQFAAHAERLEGLLDQARAEIADNEKTIAERLSSPWEPVTAGG